MIRKIAIKVWYFFAALIVVTAIGLGIGRIFITHIPQKQIERNLSEWIGMPVTVQKVNAGWYRFTPVVQLSGIKISQPGYEKYPVKIKQLSIGIDLWESLMNRKLSPGLLMLDGAHVKMVLSREGELLFPYISNVADNLSSADTNKLAGGLINWLFKQDEVQFKNVSLDFDYVNYHRTLRLNNIKMINDKSEHHLNGTMQILQPDNAALTFIANLKGSNYRTLSGDFYLNAKHIPLSLGAHNFFLQSVRLKEGIVDASTWGHLLEGKIKRVETKVRFSDLLFLNEKNLSLRRVPYFNTTLFYRNEKGLAEIQSHFNFYSRNKKNDNQLLLKQTDKGFVFQINKVHMQSFLNWYQYFELPLAESIKNNEFEGDITNLNIKYANGAFQSALFDFDKLALSFNNAIHLNHLTGQAYISPHQGFVSLDSHHVGMAVLKPYDKAISFHDLEGHYRWEKLSEGWRIISDKSHVTSSNISFDSEFIFNWQGTLANSTLKMKSDFHLKHADELRPYLPQSEMNKKSYHWMHQAFSHVPSIQGEIFIDGKLSDIPYSNKSGQLIIKADAAMPEFKFIDDWPAATEVKAHIDIHNEVLNATLLHAKLGQNKMDGLKLLMAPLGKHEQFLYVHAGREIDVNETLAYLFQTPMKEKIDVLKKIDLKGPIYLDFGLTIPLYPENDKNSLRGMIKFKHDQVSPGLMPDMDLKSLTGTLYFDEDIILKSHLKARLFDEPINIELSHQLQPNEAIQLAMNGHMSISKLKQVMNYPFLQYLKGKFDYQAMIKMPDSGDNQFIFTSSLKGVTSELPYPMQKTKKMIEPLTITSRSNDNETELHIDYNHLLKSALFYKKKNNKMLLEHGAVTVSKQPLNNINTEGMSISIKLRELDVDKWYRAFMAAKTQQDTPFSLLDLNELNIQVDKLNVKGTPLRHFSAKVRKTDKGWEAALLSSAFKGRLSMADTLPHDIYGHFDYLHLNDTFKQDNTLPYEPDDLPPISLFIQSLDFNGVELGELSYRSKTKNHQVIIDKLLLRSEWYYLLLKGVWDKQKTQLEGHWENRNLGKLLQNWHITPVVESNQTAVDFKLGWPASLSHFDMNKVKGRFSMSMRHGRITHLSPETEKELALGKILSIVSLQTIPRRLVLDFSDLTHKGFSFDLFNGKFILEKGVIQTKNAYIDGTIANVDINGAINVMKKQYDLLLKVSPHITATLSAVATIAGGPIIEGMFNWFANKVATQEKQRVIAYSYEIKGPWDKPNIEQLDITHRPQTH